MASSIFSDIIGKRKKARRGDTEMNRYVGQFLMGNDKEVEKAKKTLREIHYMTLATTSRDLVPWSCPLFCAFDKNYNFYWISSQQCVHSDNIRRNKKVAFVIYDSRIPEGFGFGVYFEAEATAVEKTEEITKALKLLYTRKKKPIPNYQIFYGDTTRKVYKAVPTKAWINDIGSKVEELKNIRTEISLK